MFTCNIKVCVIGQLLLQLYSSTTYHFNIYICYYYILQLPQAYLQTFSHKYIKYKTSSLGFLANCLSRAMILLWLSVCQSVRIIKPPGLGAATHSFMHRPGHPSTHYLYIYIVVKLVICNITKTMHFPKTLHLRSYFLLYLLKCTSQYLSSKLQVYYMDTDL